MENIFALIVEAERLSDEKAMALFDCDAESLKKIIAGEEKPGVKGLYNVNRQYGVSMALMMDGEPSDATDRVVMEQFKSQLAQSHSIARGDAFYQKLVDLGIHSIDREHLFEIYDQDKDLVNISGLIVRDNYELYQAVKSLGVALRPGGYRLNPLREHPEENRVADWHQADSAMRVLFLNGHLHDRDFNKLFAEIQIEKLSLEKACDMLSFYQAGRLEFDPAMVLRLIEHGAVIVRVASTEVDNWGRVVNRYEKDIFATMLLKEYCEKLLKK